MRILHETQTHVAGPGAFRARRAQLCSRQRAHPLVVLKVHFENVLGRLDPRRHAKRHRVLRSWHRSFCLLTACQQTNEYLTDPPSSSAPSSSAAHRRTRDRGSRRARRALCVNGGAWLHGAVQVPRVRVCLSFLETSRDVATTRSKAITRSFREFLEIVVREATTFYCQ